MAVSDFVPVPSHGLLAEDYVNKRAKFLNGPDAATEAFLGNPEWSHASL